MFLEAVTKTFPELSQEEVFANTTLEEPRDINHGDFACAVAFKLAKKLHQNPQEISEKILENFPKDFRIESISFANPGYLNIRLSHMCLAEALKSLEQGFSVENPGAEHARPIVIDYSSTNAAKHMGVHHIITTILGDALANLFSFMGYSVVRINHLGDWGTQFGKIIYALEHWGDMKAVEKNPNEELSKLYVKFCEEEEKNPDLSEEARKIFKSLEDGDETRIATWKWIVAESLKDLQKIFARLGVQFDHIMGESFYLKMADEVIKDGLARKLLKEGEGGALIFPMGEEAVPALLRKGDSTTLYLTRDVATIKYRVETWHPEAILYVVDRAQSLHFEQNFAVARAFSYAEDSGLEHIKFGRMSFEDSAMSTRKGNVIRLDAMLDEAVARAGQLAVKRGSELPRAELFALTETIGVASTKYAILSQDRNKDIIFDWNKIITLEGNSAPYLLYSYARANSIIGKAGDTVLSGMPALRDDAEKLLVRKMLKFPEALEGALNERKPHIIATALFELCQEFNRFYSTMPVLNAENEADRRTRIGIVHAFMNELKSGLSILGIPVLMRM